MTDTTVTISWATDEESGSRILYGLAQDYGSEATDDSLVTAHNITLLGLFPSTTFHYALESADTVGNISDRSADDTFTTLHGAASLAELGWAEFAAANYDDDAARFDSSLARDSEYLDAHNGRGWTDLRRDDLTNALIHFATAHADSAFLDPFAGSAFAHLAINEYSQAANDAAHILVLEPDYVFIRDTTVTYYDVALVAAQAHFRLAEYTDALAYVLLLNPDFSLEPDDPQFVALLLLEIERLRAGG